MLQIYFIWAFMITIVVLLVMTMITVSRVLALVRGKQKLSWWQRFLESVNPAVPIERESDIDTGHDFDGIRELDNHLPPWWKGLFYGCIIWGAGYLVVYHVTDSLPLQLNEYQAELANAEEHARIVKASQPAEAIDENTLEYVADEAILARGKTVFTSNNCGSCHRNDGGGNSIGPNLTDEYWLHGGSIKDIFSTVNKGVVEKGMPAWGKVMSSKDVRDVAFYIMSLKGTNPPDAKKPQGEISK